MTCRDFFKDAAWGFRAVGRWMHRVIGRAVKMYGSTRVIYDLPSCHLDIYGAPRSEIRGWILSPNVVNHGGGRMQSEEYVNEVVGQHAFVISLSCTEGMQSSIATCMTSSLMPLVTSETGFDDCPHVLLFEDWHIESVQKLIRQCAEMPPARSSELERAVQAYPQKPYTANAFQHLFHEILLNDGY